MKRLFQYANLAAIFAMFVVSVGIAYSIWHDLRPAPQPVAPTNARVSLVYTSTPTLTMMLSTIQAELNVQRELNAKYDAMGDLVTEMDKMLTRHEEELRIALEIIKMINQMDAERLGVKLPATPKSGPGSDLWIQHPEWKVILNPNWTRAPPWPLDLPPSGATQRSDPFNP